MPNQKEQLENEIKHLHDTFEAIEECFKTGELNEDNDTVLSQFNADRINMLLAGVE